MQKQEKLVSHLNNNEFVHNNNNKSLFLAKKNPQACTPKNLYELCNHFDLSLLIGMNFFDLNYRAPVYVNLFISLK